MVFKGTIGTGGTVTSLPTTGYSAGWTYKVITAGTYAGKVCEVGDLIICAKDYASPGSNDDWTVAQTNIDGAVTGPENAVTGNIPVFDNNSGRIIIDSTTSLSSILSRLDDLEYIPISITAMSVSPATVELGSTQTTATITKTLNRDAKSITLDGATRSETGKNQNISLTGLSLTATKTWTLVATDNRDYSVTKTAKMTFTNKVKYGMATLPASTTTAGWNTFLNSLPTRTLNTGIVTSFKVADTASDKYLWYAIPSSYATTGLTFTVGGFQGGVTKVETFNHTNESGYTVSYDVYRSNNPGVQNNASVVVAKNT